MDRTASILVARFQATAGPQRRRVWAAPIVNAVLAIACLLAILWDTSIYFGPQARSLEVLKDFNPVDNGITHETVAALSEGRDVYLSPRIYDSSILKFMTQGLTQRPGLEGSGAAAAFHLLVPESNLPLPAVASDVLILLDRDYWNLQAYIRGLYPGADNAVVNLSDGTQLYVRLEVPGAQLLASRGLTRTVTMPDGSLLSTPVARIDLSGLQASPSSASWTGTLWIQHGDRYDFAPSEGLNVIIDGSPALGSQYLGRGMYDFLVDAPRGFTGQPSLRWSVDGAELSPLPDSVLFRVPPPASGCSGKLLAQHELGRRAPFSPANPVPSTFLAR